MQHVAVGPDLDHREQLRADCADPWTVHSMGGGSPGAVSAGIRAVVAGRRSTGIRSCGTRDHRCCGRRGGDRVRFRYRLIVPGLVEYASRQLLRRALRRLRFPDGTFCEVRDLDGLDTLLSSTAHRDGWVDRMQRHLQFALFATIACVALAAAAYKWGLPWAAAQGARHLPPAVGKAISVQTLKILDSKLLMPSKIAGERQQALRAKLHALQLPEGGSPDSELLFRSSPL